MLLSVLLSVLLELLLVVLSVALQFVLLNVLPRLTKKDRKQVARSSFRRSPILVVSAGNDALGMAAPTMVLWLFNVRRP